MPRPLSENPSQFFKKGSGDIVSWSQTLTRKAGESGFARLLRLRDNMSRTAYQHPRSQQKVVMVAGAYVELRVYFVYYTMHRHGPQRQYCY